MTRSGFKADDARRDVLMTDLITCKKWLRILTISLAVSSTALLPTTWVILRPASWACQQNVASSEIFQGIVYGCRQLNRTEEGSGSVHWVRIDLTARGIELYVTPLDATAVAHVWQYRLRRVKDGVNEEKLAAAVNGTLFTSDSNWLIRMPGDFARSVETVVSDHVINHIWEHTYLLWFDRALAPHLRPAKPPTTAELAAAKWGVGGQAVWLWEGRVWPGSDRTPDSRTAVAIDGPGKFLYLAIAQHISPRLCSKNLPISGPRDGMLLDGGGSSSMAIGEAAKGIAAGRYGGWRPVATQFGVRALAIRR